MIEEADDGEAGERGEPLAKAPEKEPTPGHHIEVAKSGRARCRTCNEGIAKGELRLGEEVPNPFSDSGGVAYRWHHLACAAKKRPRELREALGRATMPIENRAELEETIRAWEDKQHAKRKATSFPYAERSPSDRSKCMRCREPIAKGAFRVAVERPGMGPMGGVTTGYLHAGCAAEATGDADLVAKLEANSVALSPDELVELASAVRGG